jgi:hypothetical protein
MRRHLFPGQFATCGAALASTGGHVTLQACHFNVLDLTGYRGTWARDGKASPSWSELEWAELSPTR